MINPQQILEKTVKAQATLVSGQDQKSRQARDSEQIKRPPLSGVKTAHSFSYLNRWFAFDPGSCSYFEINEATHDVIQAIADKAGSLDKSLATHGEAAIESVLKDLQSLLTAGYFAADQPETAADIDQYINALVPQVSSSIKLDISEACNLACRYCYAEGGSFGHEPMLMSKEVAKKAIDLLFSRSAPLKSNHVGIVFLGGEPLVNLEVMKFAIDYSQILGKEYGKQVGYSMTTNATLLSDEAIDLICRYRIGIKVSVDGTKDVHDYLRPYKSGKGTFDDVISNLRKLVAKRGYPPAVRAVITKENLSLTAVAKFLEEIGFNIIGFGFAEGNCYEKSELDLGPEDWQYLRGEEQRLGERIIEQLDNGDVVKFNPYGRLLQKIHHRVKTRMRCGYARGTITVAADGKIFPCPLSPGKREPYVIGDVWQGIDPARVKAMVADYYKVKKYCHKTCWAKHICGGPCPTYVAHESGRHRAPDSTHCDFVRSGYEFGIWFYQQLKEKHPDYLNRVLEAPV